MIKEISKFLEDNKLQKSSIYFERIFKRKTKWAKSYYKTIFDAEVSTTSRAESFNSIIKKYLCSRSEVSDNHGNKESSDYEYICKAATSGLCHLKEELLVPNIQELHWD